MDGGGGWGKDPFPSVATHAHLVRHIKRKLGLGSIEIVEKERAPSMYGLCFWMCIAIHPTRIASTLGYLIHKKSRGGWGWSRFSGSEMAPRTQTPSIFLLCPPQGIS